MPVPEVRRERVLFALALLPILLGVLVLGAYPLSEHAALGLTAIGGASAGWLAALALAARGAGDLRLVVAGALALRLLAWSVGPTLSDDVYRYAWEGELVASGVSPYAHAPDDPALAAARERLATLHARVNHPEIPAAYPPLAQVANALVTRAAHAGSGAPGLRAVPALRGFYTLCDLAALGALLVLLRRRGQPPELAVAWAWSPLVAVEFAGAGHLDAFGIALLVAALAALASTPPHSPSGRLRGALLLTSAGLVKLLPLAVLPFALRGRGRAALLRDLALGAGLVVLAYLSFALLAGGTSGMLAGLAQYGRRWEGGSLVFRWVDRAVRALPSFGLDPQLTSRRLVGLVWLACVVHAWRRGFDPARAAFVVLGAFVVLSPTLHPWYLTWIVPFVALFPRPSWAWLVAAAPLAYATLPGWVNRGVWEEPAWVWPVTALPFFALFVHEAWRARLRAIG